MESFHSFLHNFTLQIENAKTKVKTDEDLEHFDKLITSQIEIANKLFPIEVSSLLENTGLRDQLNKMANTINSINSLKSYEIDTVSNKVTLMFSNSSVSVSLIDLNPAARIYFRLDPIDVSYVFLLSYLAFPERFETIQVYNALVMNCSPNLH